MQGMGVIKGSRCINRKGRIHRGRMEVEEIHAIRGKAGFADGGP